VRVRWDAPSRRNRKHTLALQEVMAREDERVEEEEQVTAAEESQKTEGRWRR
jgi:hypothetical protein